MPELDERVIWKIEREFTDGGASWPLFGVLHWPEDPDTPIDIRIGSTYRPLSRVQARSLAAAIIRALDGPQPEPTVKADSREGKQHE